MTARPRQGAFRTVAAAGAIRRPRNAAVEVEWRVGAPAVESSSNSANRRGMRKSYDKCLTAPIARFMVLNKCRMFLALNCSVAATRKIAEEVDRRRRPWVRPAFASPGPAANLYLTLKFLGSIGEELVEGITGACRRVATRHQPIEASANGLGAFPSLQKPNVLWVGVEARRLAALQRDVEAR